MIYRRYANRATLRLAAAKFNEEDHCRDLAGKFTECVGEGIDERLMRDKSEYDHELFDEITASGAEGMIFAIDDDIAALKKHRAKMRKSVRGLLNRLESAEGRDIGDNFARPEEIERIRQEKEERDREVEDLERQINEGAPRLRAVERRIRGLERARKVLDNQYANYAAAKSERRRKDEAAARLRDPERRAAFKASMDRLLEARKAFEGAYLEIYGQGPDEYAYPTNESDVERRLDPDD